VANFLDHSVYRQIYY